MEGYTEEFEASFLELLRQSHPFSRVAAKVVYNDYIANKCGSLLNKASRACSLPGVAACEACSGFGGAAEASSCRQLA